MKFMLSDAYLKLKSAVYFDNTDLHLRAQLAVFDSLSEKKINDLQQELEKGKISKYFKDLLSQVNLRFYPKKINRDKKVFSFDFDKSCYTNHTLDENSTVERISIFCDLPIELQLVSYLWVIEYGVYLDNSFPKSIMGNRLIINEKLDDCDKKPEIIKGKSMLKPYFNQFQKWWYEGIKKSKQLLEENENVMLLNFDLKDYYHSINLDFDEVCNDLEKLGAENVKSNFVHTLMVEIHKAYFDKFKELNHGSHKEKNGTFPLPIGIPSSFVLANWYLKDFDNIILNNIKPVYYSRYVDDIIIVLKDRNQFNVVAESSLNEHIKNVIDYNFDSIFKIVHKKDNGDNLEKLDFKLKDKYESISIQQEKFFIYRFNYQYTPDLLNKFIDEQKKRSSEFRFLSDELDETFNNFDEHTFEDNFETSEVNSAKFKHIEENKFRISIYLAKLIKKSIQLNDKTYKEDEVKKIERFFKGFYALKNYFFWEKIFTLFLVYDKPEFFVRFYCHVDKQIKGLSHKIEDINSNDAQISILSKLKNNLNNHLTNAALMALELDPQFVQKTKHHKIFYENFKKVKHTIFRKTGLLRGHYVYYPLSQYVVTVANGKQSLVVDTLFANKELKTNPIILKVALIHFHVKFYDLAILYAYTNVFNNTFDAIKKNNYIDEAKESYNKINNIANPNNNNFIDIKELTQLPINNIKAYQCKVNDLIEDGRKTEKPKSIVCALINKYVDTKENYKSFSGNPILNSKRLQEFARLIDDVNSISDCKLFVMPEITLPYAFVPYLVSNCARKDIGFVTGIEHIRVDEYIYNFILTSLPVEINGVKDMVPILRLKNNYAPEEMEMIEKHRLKIPANNQNYYKLFIWRNFYFSSYYCFELANTLSRSIFIGKIDAIIAPVWNKDVNYYNNIVETTTRDLHCYFLLSNTSQYGYSRITRPTKKERLDLALVKKGTVSGFTMSIVCGKIQIDELREFQKLSVLGQLQECKRNEKSYKMTPPDFKIDDVNKRISGDSFI